MEDAVKGGSRDVAASKIALQSRWRESGVLVRISDLGAPIISGGIHIAPAIPNHLPSQALQGRISMAHGHALRHRYHV